MPPCFAPGLLSVCRATLASLRRYVPCLFSLDCGWGEAYCGSMKPVSILFAVLLLLSASGSGAASLKWETDFKEAAESAKKSNRYMLVDFTGSDWCGWCIKLDAEVFSKKEFREYAEKNLVCVSLDFPRKKALKQSLKEQNEQLAAKYAVRGFPTVLILSPSGDTVARTGYQDGGAEKYVEHLKSFIDPHRTKNKVPEPVSETQSRSVKPSVRAAANAIPRDENREMRTWTSKAGVSIEASLLEEKGPYLVLKKGDGSQVQILTAQVSVQDGEYVSSLRAALAAPAPAAEAP